MLKFIRRNAEATWVKLMFVAIVVVFIFWGMGGIVGGEKAQVVARVNADVIEPADFNRTYNNLLRMYQDLYKDKFKPELVKGLDLKGKAVDQLIQLTLLRQEAGRLGLSVGETEVRDAIVELPAFQQDGRFDKDLYLRVLRANNLTPGDFEDSERQELLVNKLRDLILAGVHVNEAEVHDRYRFDNEKVNLSFIKLDAATFVPQVTLTDAEVQAYFAEHQEAFRAPDRVRLEYILYSPEKFAEQAAVSDADVQQYYDSHVGDYSKPEQVHAREILFKVPPGASPELKAQVRQKADEVLAKVKAGEDFAALAEKYSEDPSASRGGDLGTFASGTLPKALDEAAFALAAGETSGLVESPLGLHIIKVEAKDPARTQPLDEVRPQIVAALKQDKARELARTQADAGRASAVAGTSLADIAAAAGLSVSTPPPLAQSESLPGLDRTPDLTNAIFATGAGEVGPTIGTKQGFVVFRVSEKLPSHVPPLSETRDRVEQAMRQQRAEELAKSKAEALLPQVQKAGIESVAAQNDLKVDETGPFGRRGTAVPKIGSAPELKKAAFQLTTENPVAPAVYAIPGASVLAALKERIPADEAKFAADKDQLMRQAEERAKGEAMEEFLNYLKAHASIELGEEYLASIPETGHPLDGGPRRRR